VGPGKEWQGLSWQQTVGSVGLERLLEACLGGAPRRPDGRPRCRARLASSRGAEGEVGHRLVHWPYCLRPRPLLAVRLLFDANCLCDPCYLRLTLRPPDPFYCRPDAGLDD
jgi:hypothetical protein